MPAFAFYNPAPVFFDLLGLEPVNGGFLHFYDRGTTNDRDTWDTPEMDIADLNPNPVPLDSAGRANAPIFLDGEYTVVCKDSLGATIWTRDVIPGGDSALTIPALENGEFLTNDSVNLLWQTVRQMPDATGSTGQVPVTNGGGANGYTLQDLPEAPTLDIVITASSVRIGDGSSTTKWFEQVGDDSAAATGTKTATASVTFPTAFTSLLHISIVPTSASSCATANIIPGWAITAQSATGFTVTFSTLTGGSSADGFSGSNIVNSIPFDWKATGTLVVP